MRIHWVQIRFLFGYFGALYLVSLLITLDTGFLTDTTIAFSFVISTICFSGFSLINFHG